MVVIARAANTHLHGAWCVGEDIRLELVLQEDHFGGSGPEAELGLGSERLPSALTWTFVVRESKAAY